MTDRAKELAEALRLAANRLHRCAIDWHTGSEKFIEIGEWADEARAALAAYDAAPAPSDDSRIDEAVLKEKMRMMEWCAKRQKITRLNWERAARKALAGDLSELRTRIDLIDAGPLDVVLSGEREQP